MPIPVTCQCGRSFSAPDTLAGKRVKCPKCGQPLAIPGAGPAAPSQGGGGGSLGNLLDEAGVPTSPRLGACPKCGAALPAGAVLCVTCGYHIEKGKALLTRRSGAARRAENPYDAPLANSEPDARGLRPINDQARRGFRLLLISMILQAIFYLPMVLITLYTFLSADSVSLQVRPDPSTQAALAGAFCVFGAGLLVALVLALVGAVFCFIGSAGTGSQPYIVGAATLTIFHGMLNALGVLASAPFLLGLISLGAQVCWALFIFQYSRYLGLRPVQIGALVLAGFLVATHLTGDLVASLMGPVAVDAANGAIEVTRALAARNLVPHVSSLLNACGQIWLLSNLVRG